MPALSKILTVLILAASSAMAEFPVPEVDFQPQKYVCQKVSEPLLLDGILNDKAWLDAAWTENFVDIEGSSQANPTLRTRVKMLWDEEYFYFAAELTEPHVWANLTKRDAVIFYDNDFEIFIDPDGDTHNYYELEVNALGTEWDLLLLKPYRDGDRVAVDSWDIDGLITAINIDGTINDPSDSDTGWSLEIAIPWQVLEECADKPRPEHLDQWRVNFSRVQWDTEINGGKYIKTDAPEHNWVWSPQGLIAMHYPEMWGIVQFADDSAGQNSPPILDNADEAAKWALRQIYYGQKRHHDKAGAYTQDLSSLEFHPAAVPGFQWPPSVILTTAGYEARLAATNGSRDVTIRQDGLTQVIQNENQTHRVHAFYYPWYGTPETDGEYFHWRHDVLGDVEVSHEFPGGADIGADFYPQLGCYSSHDPAIIEQHMEQLLAAGVGTICVSWWGRDSFEDRAIPLILDAAAEHDILVNFHLEPFPGRNAKTTRDAISYITDSYGHHPAFYRSEGRPMFYVYDSYLTPAQEWATLLDSDGAITIRGTAYDADFIGLWVQEQDGDFFLTSGFDGFYNYFAVNGFTFGSTWHNWPGLAQWATAHDKIFIPCVGPGYRDTRIRPWNGSNIREREAGRYYDRAFGHALSLKPAIIGITSFNEWHEGTQIEPSVPFHSNGFEYDNFLPLEPNSYLQRTRVWTEKILREADTK